MTNKILTIIPQLDCGLITEISENTVKTITKIDIPYNSISKISGNTVATLDKDNKKIILYSIDGTYLKSIAVPFGMAMNIKDSVVYVGGNARTGEVCYLIDISKEDPTLENINLPVQMGWGKAVDDILIVGNKMMLIDDIAYPKYTFEYDISNPNEPVWVKTIELPDSRPYEHIIKGDMNDDWMIYLSTSSSGYSGDACHISIEGKRDIVLSVEGDKYNDENRPYFWYKDICLLEDRLYVLTDIGLGYYDLTLQNIDTEDIIFIKHKTVADRIINVDETRLLLISKYDHELLDLENLEYFNGSIMEKFWSYGSINLSNRKLKEFPMDKIKNLEALQYLNLSDNRIKEFPEELRVCKQLRSLNLYFSGIEKVPFWIEEFEDLEYLNLSTINIDNPIPLMASRIKFPKKLKILNLRYCQLGAIPPSVFELKDLEYLNLLENHISKIPDKIENLKKLKTLKMRWEEVRNISDNIKDLPIETIEVSSANGDFPKVVYLMTNLKRIETKGAGIKKISKKITNLSKLEYLDLRDNYDLAVLPENIGELKKLKTLGISVCNLKKLPESICELTQLETLHLQHNKLTELPKNFGNLKHLRKLDLEGNKLQTLPESFKNLSELRSLLISRNKLKSLPKGIAELQKISVVDLWDNKLSVFPEMLCDLKHLTKLELWQNNIPSIPAEIQKLRNLSQFNIGDNALKTLPAEIGTLKKLRELDLYKNQLTALPESIGELKLLTELSVSDNALTDLPDTLFILTELKKLSLKNNQLKELPEQISQLVKLKELEIEGNEFTTLPDSMVHLKNLESISIPDYVFTLTHAQYDWIRESDQNSGSIFSRLPLPPSSYMSISDRVFTESKDDVIPVVEDNSIDTLIHWVNEKKIDELEWREPWSEGDDGSWDGFPRDKDLILRFKELNLLGARSQDLPKEIGYLTNLVKLNLGENNLTALPDEIINLTKLSFINLSRNTDLKLTTKQIEWLSTLKKDGATVWTNDE